MGEVDLVRNYIAMRLPSGEQERAFFEIWAPIEAILDDERPLGRSGMGELTSFLRHYDAMQFGVLPPQNKIYARFRDEMKQLNRARFFGQVARPQAFRRALRRFAAPRQRHRHRPARRFGTLEPRSTSPSLTRFC